MMLETLLTWAACVAVLSLGAAAIAAILED